jgi:hypothetical protein
MTENKLALEIIKLKEKIKKKQLTIKDMNKKNKSLEEEIKFYSKQYNLYYEKYRILTTLLTLKYYKIEYEVRRYDTDEIILKKNELSTTVHPSVLIADRTYEYREEYDCPIYIHLIDILEVAS